MSFSENLQNLRNSKKMTQDELAEKLDVSRQAVSKWESGSGYPETEKIITICEIFNCSMDTLMKGKISLDNTDDRKKYDAIFNKFSKGTALGVGIILLGVTILIALGGEVSTGLDVNVNHISEKPEEVFGVIILLTCILIAVPIFIYLGLEMEHFKKKKPRIANIYTEDEADNYSRKFAFILSGCVAAIIFGVIAMIFLYGANIFSEESTLPVVVLLSIITIIVPLIIHFSIQKSKYDIEEYNKAADIEVAEAEDKVGRACGTIMLFATFIFMFLGFLWDLWDIAWAVFPLGGILCAIVATLFSKE